MSKKAYSIHIWFLDNDLVASAQMLTDKALKKSIDGCIGALTSTCMYLTGIRNKKICECLFSKDNRQTTLIERFPGWPLKKDPSFSSYSWKESKWCRMCHENLGLTIDYLSILLDEWIWRHSSTFPAHSMIDWARNLPVFIDFPYAGLDKAVLPWKCIDSKFRTEDIISGYRKQYCAMQIDDGDPFAAYARCKRDIPEFVVEEFNLDNAFER